MNYPFHMPGHKRNPAFLSGSDVEQAAGLTHPLTGAYAIDTTETPATDDLYHATGILKEAQQRANALYAQSSGIPEDQLETFFLTGGATAGVLSAVSTVMPQEGDILAARNAHQSFYHAAYLRRLHVTCLFPDAASDGTLICPFAGGITAEQVRDALAAHHGIRAVFVTSPTYEGVLSDIAGIVRHAHAHHIPVIVDAAHGAHLELSETLPEGALSQGADIVIHAVHKTLGALTQTALLHVQGGLVDRALLQRHLRIFQSSSPSYVLMASIDAAVNDIVSCGRERFLTLSSFRARIEEASLLWSVLTLVPRSISADPCKAVVLAPDGFALAEALRAHFHIEVEMAQSNHIVLIVTPYDTVSGIRLLTEALTALDKELAEEADDLSPPDTADLFFPTDPPPVCAMTIARAWDAQAEEIPVAEAAGRINAEMLYCYPPGIPYLVPGEVWSDETVTFIQAQTAPGRIRGIRPDGFVRVVKDAD